MRHLVAVVALFLVVFGATHSAVAAAPDTFKDCDVCPEMVVIPAGQFMMGSPSNEEGRDVDEGPVHRVQVPSFALGKYEVTRGQFAAFVKETGYSAGGDCHVDKGGGDLGQLASKNWARPEFSTDGSRPGGVRHLE